MPASIFRFLRSPAEAHHGRIYALTERFFQGMLSTYRWTLERCLAHRPAGAPVEPGCDDSSRSGDGWTDRTQWIHRMVELDQFFRCIAVCAGRRRE